MGISGVPPYHTQMRHASLFSSFGAADLAACWMGWENAFWCETDSFCRTVLSYWFPKSQKYGNIKETDFTPWRGKIDILTGGFPCQPFSLAGQRKGADDDRYLWPEMLRAIREIRPTWVIGENVAGILSMVQPGGETEVERQASLFEETDKETVLEQEFSVETVCRDLEQEGYSVQPVLIPACAVEAPHRRDRVFFIAYRSNPRPESLRPERENKVHKSGTTSNPDRPRLQAQGTGQQTTGIAGSRPQGVIANPNSQRSEQVQQAIQSKQPERDGINSPCRKWNVTDAHGERMEGPVRAWNRFTQPANLCRERPWANFPAQSPVCRGNDGLPFDVVRLALPPSKWREGAVKGYGNTIVPQVMLEIFKAIETSTFHHS